MKRKLGRLLLLAGALTLLLTACKKTTSPEDAAALLAPTDGEAYADYAGYQFSGSDPWGGAITVTVKSIYDGKMEWTFTDSFDDHTLYQLQKDTVLLDGEAEFDLQGQDVEQRDVSFAFAGDMALKDGAITLTLRSGSVTDTAGQALRTFPGGGLSDQIVLDKAAGPYLRYAVQSGDSMHSIARKYGLSTKDLVILNQIVIEETARAHGLEFDDVTEYAKYLYPGEELLIRDAVAKAKPDILLVTLGIDSIALIGKDDFVRYYTTLIDAVKAASPDTKIILNSIYPVADSYKYKKDINNDKINAANGWIEDLAVSRGCRFLYSWEALAVNGKLPETMQNGDGLHLNGEAFTKVMQYIRTHAYA